MRSVVNEPNTNPDTVVNSLKKEIFLSLDSTFSIVKDSIIQTLGVLKSLVVNKPNVHPDRLIRF